MDPINPWLDSSEVRKLAEQLMRPVAQSGISSSDPGFDTSFIGFTDNTESTDAQEEQTEPAVIENKAIESHAPTSLASSSDAEKTSEDKTEDELVPKTIAATSKQFKAPERIQIFRNWLSDYFDATEIFILDGKGEVIFDESGHGRLHFIARNLVLAPNNSSSIHVKIGPSAVLELIPCETSYGRVILGALVKKSLLPEQLENIIEVLKQTASPS